VRLLATPSGGLTAPDHEAFSDGIFVIAIPLLVLERAVPAVTNGSLLPGLARLWPSYLAYVISLFSSGTIWILHYAITRSLRGADASGSPTSGSPGVRVIAVGHIAKDAAMSETVAESG
jgi:transmembrane protein TMEM174 (potassium channel)